MTMEKKKNENVDRKTQERVCPEEHPEINHITLTNSYSFLLVKLISCATLRCYIMSYRSNSLIILVCELLRTVGSTHLDSSQAVKTSSRSLRNLIEKGIPVA
ncbi:hypothetical protein ISN44_As07g011510 [Arabidopsis suecica]|uniref:Uncharacterized protein n=1 Tax=Arabidopsis suecica TaxID=45249 RepID=A0A8T2BMU5_ARASU|nr:hypothetical protein ISN44_As07g011510 [Arabidopsis suecica]